MPKNRRERSALHRARAVFPRNISETEESDSSEESNHDLAHIPIEDTPELNLLNIEPNIANMEQLTAQLTAMAATLANIGVEQQRQQELINILGAQNAGQANPPQVAPQAPAAVHQHANFFAIPDPIKHGISKFEGNKKQLNSWLMSVETTLEELRPFYTEEQNAMFLRSIINGKIEGKAKDRLCANGNPTTFQEVKEILLHHLGDHQDLTYYKCQLWQHTKTPNMSYHNYYNTIKETIQMIKNLSLLDADYRASWPVINKMIEDDAVTAFLIGLPKDLFGLALTARPKNIEEAYAFICKFKSTENISNNRMLRIGTKTETKYEKPQFKKYGENNQKQQNNANYPTLTNDPQEPMEIGSSRSKLTLNKRQFNNNEIPEGNSSDSEEEGVDINFCLAGTNHAKT